MGSSRGMTGSHLEIGKRGVSQTLSPERFGTGETFPLSRWEVPLAWENRRVALLFGVDSTPKIMTQHDRPFHPESAERAEYG